MPNADKAAPETLEVTEAPEDGLTTKQRLFVEHYLKFKNGVHAAKYAGYKGTNQTLGVVACENLTKPKIKAALQHGFAIQSKKLEYTHELIIARMNKIYERCMVEEPVLDRQGNPTGEFRFEAHGALRANELIGKHYGMWREKDDGDGKNKPDRGNHFQRIQEAFRKLRDK